MNQNQIFAHIVVDGNAGRSLPMIRAYKGSPAAYAVHPKFDTDGIRMRVGRDGGSPSSEDGELCRCDDSYVVKFPATAFPAKGEFCYQVVALTEIENGEEQSGDDDTPSYEETICGEGIIRVFNDHFASEPNAGGGGGEEGS